MWQTSAIQQSARTVGGNVRTLRAHRSLGSADAHRSAARLIVQTGVAVDGMGMFSVRMRTTRYPARLRRRSVTNLGRAAEVDGSTDGHGSSARFGKPAEMKSTATPNLSSSIL